MKRTYIIEDEIGDVIEYFARLTDAKNYLKKHSFCGLSILALKGDYFGEGFHTHRYFYMVRLNKFKRESL